MKNLIETIFNWRLCLLFRKEMRQIDRNRKLVAMLIIPPTLNLVMLGFAMNPDVTDLRLGILDESRTADSREVISAFSESRSFKVAQIFESPQALGQALSAGRLDAGLVIASDFARQRTKGETAEIQFLVDGVDSNTAAIAGSYATRIVNSLNHNVRIVNRAGGQRGSAAVHPRISLLYNPGLKNSWFIVTGMIGVLLVMLGVAVSSSAMVKEKEMGTVEQLLMTPADGAEIIVAKIAPIFLLLSVDIGLSVAVGHFVFDLPVRGSLGLLYISGMLCVLSGIGIGTMI